MFGAPARRSLGATGPRRVARGLHATSRTLLQTTTESASAAPPPLPLPNASSASATTPKSNVTRPRPLRAWGPRPLPHGYPTLPSTFGRNQMLSVPDTTRALLEEIVQSFNAPIRYAFAYGSGVFDQAGYTSGGKVRVIHSAGQRQC